MKNKYLYLLAFFLSTAVSFVLAFLMNRETREK